MAYSSEYVQEVLNVCGSKPPLWTWREELREHKSCCETPVVRCKALCTLPHNLSAHMPCALTTKMNNLFSSSHTDLRWLRSLTSTFSMSTSSMLAKPIHHLQECPGNICQILIDDRTLPVFKNTEPFPGLFWRKELGFLHHVSALGFQVDGAESDCFRDPTTSRWHYALCAHLVPLSRAGN